MRLRDIKSIKIGPYRYKLEYVKNLTNADGVDLYGQITYSDAVIRVSKGNNKQRDAATVVHESIHAILEHAGLDETSEQTVIVLGNGIFEFIRDNPDVVKFIQDVA